MGKNKVDTFLLYRTYFTLIFLLLLWFFSGFFVLFLFSFQMESQFFGFIVWGFGTLTKFFFILYS